MIFQGILYKVVTDSTNDTHNSF